MPINPNIALQVQPPAAPPNPLDSLARVLQIKNAIAQQPLIEANVQRAGLENQQLGQQLGATKALNDAYKSAVTPGPDGTPTLDKDAITKTLASSGYGAQIPAVMQHFSEMEKTAGEVRKQKADLAESEQNYVGSLGAAAKAANYDPTVLATGLQHGLALGYQTAGQALQALQADPSKAQAIADRLIAGSPKQAQLQNEAITAAAHKTAAAAVTSKLPGELAAQEPALEKAKADAVLATAKANLLKDPNSYATQVDTLGLNPAAAMRLKSQVGFYISHGLVDEANKALDQGMQDANAPGKAAAVANAELPGKVKLVGAEAAARAPVELAVAAQNRQANEAFQSYGQAKADLDKLGTPLEQTAQKIAAIKEKMNSGIPQDWANVPAMFLGLSAGGPSSGLRMNQSLIEQEMGGAGKVAQLQGFAQQFNPNTDNASKIGPIQQDQFKRAVAGMEKQVQARLDVVNAARQKLNSSGNDIGTHRSIATAAHTQLSQLDQQAGQQGTPPQFKVGDTVMYQGKPHKVNAITNGKLVLEP